MAGSCAGIATVCSTACTLRSTSRSANWREGRQPDRRHRGQPERQERRKRGRHIDPIGYDAGKKVKGKKRHVIVDTLGLMLGLDVTPADVQDRDGFLPLLKRCDACLCSWSACLPMAATAGLKRPRPRNGPARWVWRLSRDATAKGFVVLAKRWIVERTFGWLGRCRRLTKDFENLTRTQIAFVQLAMIRLMMRRIARFSNPPKSPGPTLRKRALPRSA